VIAELFISFNSTEFGDPTSTSNGLLYGTSSLHLNSSNLIGGFTSAVEGLNQSSSIKMGSSSDGTLFSQVSHGTTFAISALKTEGGRVSISSPHFSRSHFLSHVPTEKFSVSPLDSFPVSEQGFSFSGLVGDAKGKTQTKFAFGYIAGIVVLVVVGTSFGFYALLLENRLVKRNIEALQAQETEDFDTPAVEEGLPEQEAALSMSQTVPCDFILSDEEGDSALVAVESPSLESDAFLID
jgi:hypothetical protein